MYHRYFSVLTPCNSVSCPLLCLCNFGIKLIYHWDELIQHLYVFRFFLNTVYDLWRWNCILVSRLYWNFMPLKHQHRHSSNKITHQSEGSFFPISSLFPSTFWKKMVKNNFTFEKLLDWCWEGARKSYVILI